MCWMDVGHVWGIFGHVWDMSGVIFGHVSRMFGHVWDMLRTFSGHVLDMFWTCFGEVSNMFWTSFGYNLGQVLGNIWAIFWTCFLPKCCLINSAIPSEGGLGTVLPKLAIKAAPPARFKTHDGSGPTPNSLQSSSAKWQQLRRITGGDIPK